MSIALYVQLLWTERFRRVCPCGRWGYHKHRGHYRRSDLGYFDVMARRVFIWLDTRPSLSADLSDRSSNRRLAAEHRHRSDREKLPARRQRVHTGSNRGRKLGFERF